MAKLFLCLIVSFLATDSVIASYIIVQPSWIQNCDDRVECDCGNLTLSQFVNNSSSYLRVTSDTKLIFLPGNHSLESELLVENVHSFSMYAWHGSSSKAMITCHHSARFEFRNISTVTMSGLEFIGCSENRVISVDQFQLENSGFIGNAIIPGTVLNIEESTAKLDRILFLSQNSEFHTAIVCAINSNLTVSHSTFKSNTGPGNVLKVGNTNNMSLSFSELVSNQNGYYGRTSIEHTKFINNTGSVLTASHTEVSISYNEFLGNDGQYLLGVYGVLTSIDHNKFINNTGSILTAIASHTEVSISYNEFLGNNGVHLLNLYGVLTSIDHSKFINNTGTSVLRVANTDMITLHLNEFINNKIIGAVAIVPHMYNTTLSAENLMYNYYTMSYYSVGSILNTTGIAVVYIRHHTTAENLTGNIFINNSAPYEILISSVCRPGLSRSLGSSRCIPCSDHWRRELIGIVAASFVAGIALVIFMLTLNLTVAVGTLNGILFYANILAVNADIYFLPSTTPNFVTVFISWLNLDIGFDVCFPKGSNLGIFAVDVLYKSLLQLAFPIYVIFLVIIVIVASERSSKFGKIIGKGNPVAVLATMILISLAKLLNATIVSLSLAYLQPAYGSRNVDITKIEYDVTSLNTEESVDIEATTFSLIIIGIPVSLLCVIYVALIFHWQWLLRYQDKAIFKWVRYQKLRHFIEPYHTPYTAQYRYWTGLLLIVRILLYLISVLNFSLDPRVDLLATIFIIGGLILLKGVTAKRVYKNWPLDVMETSIYFNLVAFSALTWYILDFGGNQVALAYTSVMIIFILLLGVIVLHVLRYTSLYKGSFVKKSFEWTSSKLLEKKPKEQPLNDAPEELDGYRLERSAAGDQELPTITYSVIEINEPAQSQDSGEKIH